MQVCLQVCLQVCALADCVVLRQRNDFRVCPQSSSTVLINSAVPCSCVTDPTDDPSVHTGQPGVIIADLLFDHPVTHQD